MKEKCEYCNPCMSFGNKPIYKEDGTELFIANNYLKLLKENNNMARNILIQYCPMCGEKIECPICGCRDGNHAQECIVYYTKGYGLR